MRTARFSGPTEMNLNGNLDYLRMAYQKMDNAQRCHFRVKQLIPMISRSEALIAQISFTDII